MPDLRKVVGSALCTLAALTAASGAELVLAAGTMSRATSSSRKNHGFALGHLYDPERPRQLYSLVVSLAVDPARKWVKPDELLVLPTDRDAAAGISGKAGKDKVDAFF